MLQLAWVPIAAVEPVDMTREIFGNIPDWAQGWFYALAGVSLGVFIWGCYRRIRRWWSGRPTVRSLSAKETLRRIVVDILLQRRVRGRGLASSAHLLLFSGFAVLFLGTCLIAVEHILASWLARDAHDPVFHKGAYYAVYEFTLDLFGVAMVTGLAMFAWRRRKRPPSLDHNAADWLILALLLSIGVSGFFVEGLRILREESPHPEFSFVGLACAKLWTALGVATPSRIATLHFLLWWAHAVMALSLIAAFPFTRLRHAIAGAVTLATAPTALGSMGAISVEELEQQGFTGVARISDFTRHQLTAIEACVACGRCEDACPAFEAGKPLSPKRVVQDLRIALDQWAQVKSPAADDPCPPSLHDERIAAETLWACTTCSACTDICPLRINPAEMITDLRRYLISEGQLRGAAAAALQKTQRAGNPWGLPAQERFRWAHGLQVPTVEDNPGFEILYWVGCAASYDRRSQKVARAVVQLLQHAQVNFAVLGNRERCTGECARRMGDEFLFQELAQSNLESLRQHDVRSIVTHCPHCLNSLRQDYAQFGGQFEVVHHSELLSRLIRAGRLPDFDTPNVVASGSVTYHDPCYLARVQGETEAPRHVLRASTVSGTVEPIELPRQGRQTACCGAGGGRMWFDDGPDQRIGTSRVEEILATGAQTVAVACPFCLVMLTDGLAHRQSTMEVVDVAELLWSAVTAKLDI